MAADPLLSVEEARARILAGLIALPTEEVSLRIACGRVLAQSMRAGSASPAAAVSAMDGYAVEAKRIGSVPAELAISQTIPAGTPASPLAPGTAARIFTGAVMPEGADAVVIQEDTERRGDRVVIRTAPAAGRHIRPAGSDFAAGDIGLHAGCSLTPRDIGLAAAMNAAHLSVRRRPCVAILATGDELIRPGGAPAPHQTIASSGYALAAALTVWGAEAIELGLVRDDEAAIATAIDGARECDLLLTLGGASVGDHDLVQRALAHLGFTLNFWKVAMRPGKPLLYGRLGALPVMGLPGNPVSTLICALLFVRPMIRTWLGCRSADGRPDIDLPRREAILAKPLAPNGPRADYMRGRLIEPEAGAPVVKAFERQDSSHLMALAGAGCLIPRTPFAPASKAASPHTIVPLAGLF